MKRRRMPLWWYAAIGALAGFSLGTLIALAYGGEFTVVTTDDVTLARLATEQNKPPQEVLQDLVDGYLKQQAQNGYNQKLQELREACRTGQWANPLVCDRIVRGKR